ncbi:MAG: PAS domain S-box protein, partial [Chloroflexi bacterium]
MNGENESRSIGNSGPLWDENFARIFLEAQGIGLIILDSNGRFVHTNLAFAQMVGRPPAELVSVSLFDMTHPDDHEQLQRIIILPPGQSCIQDGRILTQDGQLRWLNYHVQAKLDSGTEPLMHFYAAVQDITERKQAELATHQSETRYRQLFENALMGIFRSTPDGRFLEVNPALVRMLGYDSAADVLALKLPEDLYVDPSQRAQIQEIYDPQGVAEDVKAVWKHKDGTQIVVRIHSRVIRDDQQNVQYYEGMVQDVTRHHEAEQELLQEKALIDSISDSLPGLLVVYNQEGRRLRWNKNVELVTGYTKEELPVLPPMALMAKSKHPFLAAKMREVLVQGNTTFETHLVTKNGRTIPHFFSGHRILLDGEPAIIGLGIDISDRVEAEEKLRQSEANLQAIFNNTLQAFVLFDVNRRVLAANPRANNWARQILGKPLQGGQNADDLFAMFNIDAFQQAFAEAVQGVTTVRQHKITVANRDAWFETSYNPVITDTEEVVGVSMSVLNITEQKKNEEALLQGEARFRAIVEDQVDMIMRAKVDGTLTYVNEAYARAGNSTPEEMVGQNFLSFLGEEERKIVQGKFSRLTPDNPVEIDEHQEVLPDGSVVWLHWADRGIFNSQGQLIEVQAVGTDITHRIEAEEELRRSETRLQQIIDTVPEGVLLLDADYRVMLANPLAEQFLTLLAPDWENGRLAYLGNQPLNKLLTSPPKGLWHDIVLHNQAFEAIARPVETDYQNTGWVLLIRDVTQERDIQQQAQRQERLAAVGQLAAGIAHDFNNILAVITLYAQLILQTVKLP